MSTQVILSWNFEDMYVLGVGIDTEGKHTDRLQRPAANVLLKQRLPTGVR